MLQFFQWGILLQVLAVLHFIRRRPETFWLWVIIFFGPPGAFIYILMEVVPDLGLLRQSFEGFGRRKRIKYLEALVLQNPPPAISRSLAISISMRASTPRRASASTRRSPPARRTSIRSIGEGSPRSSWATLPPPSRTSNT
jgi:hypothetical protein